MPPTPPSTPSPELKPAAFFSYVHKDDENDEGRIVQLGRRLRAELAALSADEHLLFIDRDDLNWGDLWEDRIDKSLNASTFFIAVLTPRFFTSKECQRELKVFLERQKKLNRNDLILPIYYMGEMLEDPVWRARYPLAETIAARQWENWRHLRNRPWEDTAVRAGVTMLAKRLLAALRHTAIQSLHEAVSHEPDPEEEASGRPPPQWTPTGNEPESETPRPRRNWPKWLRFLVGGSLALVMVAGTVYAANPRINGASVRTWVSCGTGYSPPSDQPRAVVSRWGRSEGDKFEQVLDYYRNQTDDVIGYAPAGDQEAPWTWCDPPGMMFFPSPGLLKELARDGHLRPIDEGAGRLVDANYDQWWRDLGEGEDGQLYGFWYKAANKSMVWYNKQIFDDLGLVPPETWADLENVAGALLATEDYAPFALGGNEGWVLTDWFEVIYLRNAGEAKYRQLAKHGGIDWNDPTVQTALRDLQRVVGEWIVEDAHENGFESSVRQVFAGQPEAAMILGADFVADVIPSGMRGDADFFSFPSFDGTEPSVIVGGDVAVQLADHPDTRAFMEFLAKPEAAEEWAMQGGMISPNSKVPLGIYPDLLSQRAAGAIQDSTNLVFDLSDLAPPEFEAAMGEILQDFLRNPQDIGGTQDRLEEAADAAY